MRLKAFFLLFFCLAFVYNVHSNDFEELGVAVESIQKAKKIFYVKPIPKNLEEWFQYSESMAKKYPYAPQIISEFTIALYVKDGDPVKAISLLRPFLHDIEQYPQIGYTMWWVFFSGYRNYTVNGIKYFEITPWREIFLNLKVDNIKAMELMLNYWANRIPDKFPSQNNYIQFQKELSDVEKLETLKIWITIQKNIDNYEKEQVRINTFLELIEQQNKADELKLQLLPTSPNSETQEFVNVLDTLNTLPNDLQKIELTLNKITEFRRQLKQYPDIPNYEALKKNIGNYEAQVINIAYKAYILREFKDCIKLIGKLDKKQTEKDSRILAIGIYCMQKEKYPNQQIIANIDQLLKIEPKKQRAFMLKKMIEAQEEYKQKSQ